jgi:bacillopeptidase F (M6 metalloprotease family)
MYWNEYEIVSTNAGRDSDGNYIVDLSIKLHVDDSFIITKRLFEDFLETGVMLNAKYQETTEEHLNKLRSKYDSDEGGTNECD